MYILGWHKGKPINRNRWARLRRLVFDRDGYRCRTCGKAGRLECDHVKRIEDGGAVYDMGNLQTLCVGCHILKSRAERMQPNPEGDGWRELVKARIANGV